MSDTEIEYLDKTWNFIGGCSECSKGCTNCWACRQAVGRLKNHPLYQGLTKNGKWTGEIRLCTDIGRPDMLEKPLHWGDSYRIGVQFMGDLFHPKVPFEFIQSILGIIALCPQHTFLLLTKHPEKMAELSWAYPDNAWLGVSISTQKEADEKIPILLQIPATVRFLSLEPLLEHIVIPPGLLKKLNWIIVGCESKGGGLGRNCELWWIRGLLRQCRRIGLPVFVKQIPISNVSAHIKECRDISKWPKDLRVQQYPKIKGGGK